MDSLCSAAAHALSRGDPLSALDLVALRDDPPALALRGVAMAQLGELGRAHDLLTRSARAFGAAEPLSRARCQLAAAEVGLAARELTTRATDKSLQELASVLFRHGDQVNASYARLLAVRRWLLVGRIDRAQAELDQLELAQALPRMVAVAELCRAEIEVRRIHPSAARDALERAGRAALQTGIGALSAEIDEAKEHLHAPAARRSQHGESRTLTLGEVETLLASPALVIDACRRCVRQKRQFVDLSRRPVLLSIARTLAKRWPDPAARAELLSAAFGARRLNDSLRARLRVEVGRLRRQLKPLATIRATSEGFVLEPASGEVALIDPPFEGPDAELFALLSDGAAWSTSALSAATGRSQRTVQRALVELSAAGRARAVGEGPTRRWLASPATAFTTTLLLPVGLAEG
jgi:hypothetical protein